jgi:hypothetical protein
MGENIRPSVRSGTSEDNTEPLSPLLSKPGSSAVDSTVDTPAAAIPVLTRDSRDEEEDDSSDFDGDDPFTYSDDSASLSDAYFHPQSDDDLARPKGLFMRVGAEHDPLTAGLPQHPVASWYGSVDAAERSTSPLWVSGPIHEDSEAMPPFGPNLSLMEGGKTLKKVAGKDRRKRKQRKHRTERRQQEQAARERAVTQVRGKPQEVTRWQDFIFAVLFVIQLVLVVLCAFRFGFGVIRFKEENMSFSHYVRERKGRIHWQTRGVAELTHTHNALNASINELVYTDDAYTAPDTHSSAHRIPSSSLSSSSISSSTLASDDSFTIDYQNVIALVGISGFYACILAYITFGFMLILARSLIQITLIFSVVLALAWGLVGLVLDPYGVISIMAFTAVLLTLGYTMFNWNRIPFAATNLYTALCGMRCTADITILGLASLVVAFSWCIIWSMAFTGVVNSFNNVDCDTKDNCQPHVKSSHIPLYLLFLLSFHWTNTVIKNVVRVTVASAIGTWWFRPGDISPFCSSAVARPLLRSLTKSFGSICKGSLILQPAQTLTVFGKCCCFMFGTSESSCTNPQVIAPPDRAVAPEVVADESAADSVGLCQSPCCGLTDNLGFKLRSCNRWAYTYIGMYGYSFAEAGERAYQLFATREWLEVVKDNLIQNVLLLANVVIGGSTGTFAVIVEEMDGYDFTSFHKPVLSAFVVGSVIGYVMSNILMLGIVGSAVNTILVCFAAGPFEFDKNHPRLSAEMRQAWTQQVWEPPV